MPKPFPWRSFSFIRLVKSILAGMLVSAALGFPLHLISFFRRWGRSGSYDPKYIAERLRASFEIPVNRHRFFGLGSSVDALEWLLIIAFGALAGTVWFVFRVCRNEREERWLEDRVAVPSDQRG